MFNEYSFFCHLHPYDMKVSCTVCLRERSKEFFFANAQRKLHVILFEEAKRHVARQGHRMTSRYEGRGEEEGEEARRDGEWERSTLEAGLSTLQWRLIVVCGVEQAMMVDQRHLCVCVVVVGSTGG